MPLGLRHIATVIRRADGQIINAHMVGQLRQKSNHFTTIFRLHHLRAIFRGHCARGDRRAPLPRPDAA